MRVFILDPTCSYDVGENWSTGDTYIGTMGQGYVLATPLQVLTSIAALANYGKLTRPTIIKDIFQTARAT